LYDFVKRLRPDASHNRRDIIHPYEIDIIVDNVAIEYCGLFWHSEMKKAKLYHRAKHDMCKEKGIRLIQIFEDEWINNKELIKQKIKNILKLNDSDRIYARRCKIEEVGIEAKAAFFNTNHIQGNGPSSINYGLMHNEALVACIGFIKNNDGSYTLNRYATSCSVIGGFSKLLNHFERIYNKPKIITFADLRWSDGELYYKTGFKLDKILEPDYFWVKHNQRFHKFNFRHSGGLRRLEHYDSSLSEAENMRNHGFFKIYDAGKLRFFKNI